MNNKFFKENLKLYAINNDDFDLLSIVKRISNIIWMQFGPDKCAKITFSKGLSSKV